MKKSDKIELMPRGFSPAVRLTTVITAALALAFASKEAQAARPIGVDVSHYQGSINWTSVHNAGYAFAWAKCTEGTYSGTDDTFVNNENNGKAAGVYIGGYHFARPDLTGPTTEASYF